MTQRPPTVQYLPLCEVREPSRYPGFVPGRGCWLERGHDGDHAFTLKEAHERESA